MRIPRIGPRCYRCDYDLTGVASTCPECGSELNPAAMVQFHRRHHALYTAMDICALVVFVCTAVLEGAPDRMPMWVHDNYLISIILGTATGAWLISWLWREKGVRWWSAIFIAVGVGFGAHMLAVYLAWEAIGAIWGHIVH